jgi:hypothetical protein
MRIPGLIFTAVVMLTTLVERTDQWGRRRNLGEAWTTVLSKAMVVFFGLMFLIGVYVAIFS